MKYSRSKYYLAIVFIFLNGVIAFCQQLSLPYSNQISGIYTSEIDINLFHDDPDAVIFYTLNGNTPTPADNEYNGTITFENLSGSNYTYSGIPTNPSLTYPYGTYSTTRANSRGWLPPVGDVYKINVIRFRAFKPGFAPSETVTQTFMIDPLGADRYDFPILSIVVDSSDFFSDETGVYVYGNSADGNYYFDGPESERIITFQYFNKNGELAIDREVRSRIHGGGSRTSAKKNLRLYGEYGVETNFEFPFFENYALDKFKRIIIRSGGHSPQCFPRDNLANMITNGLAVDQQNLKHIILFINGEYWGIHTIKERVDNYFIQNRWGIDDNEITILDQEYDIQGNGHLSDMHEMESLEDFIINNDMSLQENYEYVLEKIDVDNYIDYMCSEIFLSNVDWVYSNVMLWRKTGPFDPSKPAPHDGKFRWILYDLDGAFGGDCSQAFYTVNTLNAATIATGTFASYSRFFRGMLDNITFRKKFVNRMCDLMNSHFKQNRIQEKIWELYNLLTPSMLEEVERWRYPSTSSTLYTRQFETPSLTQWDLTFYNLDFFAKNRQRKIRDHFMSKWAYPDSSLVTVNVNDTEMGMVKVNSILINKQLSGVSENVYPWDGYYMNTVELPIIAIPKPGYRFVEWMETGITEAEILWEPNGDTIFTAVFEADDSYQPIRINELMASNTSYLEDNFGDHDDWLELYNPNTSDINLSSTYFEWNGKKWSLPNQTIIPASGYLLFWFDAEEYQGNNHTSGKLPNSVNWVYLMSADSSAIDSIYYPAVSSNYSYGRFPNGSSSNVIFENPTPLMTNDATKLNEETINSLLVFPNPAQNVIHLSQKRSFAIYNLNGQKVLEDQHTDNTDISHLPNGVYLLITSQNERIKIVINR